MLESLVPSLYHFFQKKKTILQIFNMGVTIKPSNLNSRRFLYSVINISLYEICILFLPHEFLIIIYLLKPYDDTSLLPPEWLFFGFPIHRNILLVSMLFYAFHILLIISNAVLAFSFYLIHSAFEAMSVKRHSLFLNFLLTFIFVIYLWVRYNHLLIMYSKQLTLE